MDELILNTDSLSVGDQIENFKINYLQNGAFKEGEISDYKGK
jgi:hypothetical protein